MKSRVRSMSLQVAKWGNSLAVRIPAEYVRSIGIKEGDNLEARLTADGGLSLRSVHWDREAFARELEAARNAMPPGTPVMEAVRRSGRY